jgi:hypothetical protein
VRFLRSLRDNFWLRNSWLNICLLPDEACGLGTAMRTSCQPQGHTIYVRGHLHQVDDCNLAFTVLNRWWDILCREDGATHVIVLSEQAYLLASRPLMVDDLSGKGIFGILVRVRAERELL